MQCLDINALNVNLVLSGIDQRRIHMLYVDTMPTDICFLHFRILPGIKSKLEISKS